MALGLNAPFDASLTWSLVPCPVSDMSDRIILAHLLYYGLEE